MNKKDLVKIEKLLQDLYDLGVEEENDDVTGTVGEVLAILRNENDEV